MKKFSGLFAVIGIFCFFLWNIFFFLEERKSSWQIAINQLDKKKLIKSVSGFKASKKYKKYIISVIAKTAKEYKKKERNIWVLKDIIFTIKNHHKTTSKDKTTSAANKKNLVLKSNSAIFDQKTNILLFTDTAYINLIKYNMKVSGLSYNLKTNKLFSNNGVVVKNYSFNITAKELSYNLKDYFILKNNVKVVNKSYKSISDKLIFNDNKKHLQYILHGNVSVFIGGHNFKGESILFNPVDQSIEIKKGKIKIDESLSF